MSHDFDGLFDTFDHVLHTIFTYLLLNFFFFVCQTSAQEQWYSLCETTRGPFILRRGP